VAPRTLPGLVLLAAVGAAGRRFARSSARGRGAVRIGVPRRRRTSLAAAAVDGPLVTTSLSDGAAGGAQAENWDWLRKGARCEVLAPSKRWREAEVVEVHKDGATVHFAGYDHQFDEKVLFKSGRLRAYGQLNSAYLKDLKAGFIYQGSSGTCPGCGVRLQCTNPEALGFIPPEKFGPGDDAVKSKPLTADEEVRLLLQEEGAQEKNTLVFPTRAVQSTYRVIANVFLDVRKEPDIDAERVEGESLKFGDTFEVAEIYQAPDAHSFFRLADGRGWVFDWAMVKGARTQLIAPLEDGLSKIKAQKRTFQNVCQRCWGLWHYNDCDDIFRPAFGKPAIDELTAESFEDMLTRTLEPVTEACVLAVVDVFDFGPSFTMLQYLSKRLRGKSDVRVRIIANKVDLLPPEVNMSRLRGWVSREAQKAGLKRTKLTDVYPVSCHKSIGIKSIGKLLEQAGAQPEFYVVGAANTGKSSLLNRLSLRKRKGVGQVAAEAADGFMVSVLPGTTIAPLVMKYQQGNMKLIDTPGLLVPGSLSERLTLEDLKEVIPQTAGARRVTLQMKEDRSILMAGLGRIDMIEGQPCQFTVFSSEKLKLHRSRTEKCMDVLAKFAGTRITPPATSERFSELLPWVPHRFELEGRGWLEACCDIVFHGLGWVSITCCGSLVVEAYAPEGVKVTMREPLMPYEAKWTGVKYTGAPGWFKIRGRTTRGEIAGKKRRKVKGKF